jgi:hypothetical protein
MFRGLIQPGADVEATFRSDYSNASSALLMLGVGFYDGGSDADSAVVVPGGAATVRLRNVKEGRLELLLDMSADSETGLLQISINGEAAASEPVRGDTRWVYAVEA